MGSRGRPVPEIQVWTPDTGEVQIDALPRDTAEAKRRHALAMIGAGEWADGVYQLRQLIAAEPGAEWVPQARLMIVRGLLAGGQGTAAFRESESFAAAYPGSPLAAQVRPLELTAARVEAETDVDAAMALFERLVDTAQTADEAASAKKEEADAVLHAGRYLDAQAQYVALISFYPRSEWVPYAWYMVAECEYELATRLKLGLARSEQAEGAFWKFMRLFPDDSRVPDARKKVDEIRAARAEVNWQIARFYVDNKHKPWAAVGYLEYIVQEFPGTPQAEWAAAELKRIKQELGPPMRGEVKELQLPGVTRTAPEQGEVGTARAEP